MMGSTAAAGLLTLFAAEPGAFTAFAADIAAVMRVAASELCLDEDLDADLQSGIVGLKETSIINQAIGVLLARGYTLDDARASLEQQATVTDLSVYRTARNLISNL